LQEQEQRNRCIVSVLQIELIKNWLLVNTKSPHINRKEVLENQPEEQRMVPKAHFGNKPLSWCSWTTFSSAIADSWCKVSNNFESKNLKEHMNKTLCITCITVYFHCTCTCFNCAETERKKSLKQGSHHATYFRSSALQPSR